MSANSTQSTHTAVIADDEPLLLESLTNELKQAWPELTVLATASNGPDAIAAIFENKPSVVFLDIQMPGATGLEVAQAVCDDWPDTSNAGKVPLIVFATAFDRYAIDAYETAAVDYLVKPVKQSRLTVTVERLKARLHTDNASTPDDLAAQLHQLLLRETQEVKSNDALPLLKVIRASSGCQTRIIPIDEIILFESADKYITVYTANDEFLIREPLKKLLPQLDASKFEQVHRSAIVNMTMIEAANRDETGNVTLQVKGIAKQVSVSRVYRQLFQPM